MAKKSEEMVATGGGQSQALAGTPGGLVPVQKFDVPARAFSGFQGRIYPPVWKFTTTGECIDVTIIGESEPLTKNDPEYGEVPIVTYECAFTPDFRIRLQCQHQLIQMLPSLEGKMVRIVFREEKDHGRNRVYIYDAGVFDDQSRAVRLTDEELARNVANRERRETERLARAAESKRLRAERAALEAQVNAEMAARQSR